MVMLRPNDSDSSENGDVVEKPDGSKSDKKVDEEQAEEAPALDLLPYRYRG
jgi:hypothetical protein